MKRKKSSTLRKVGKGTGFLVLAVGTLIATYAMLEPLGLTPDPPKESNVTAMQPPARTVAPDKIEQPVRIVAKDIGLDADVVNPMSKDIGVLDRALLSGAVRYPQTAQLGTDGTMLLFGHSSNLPIVRNQAYKTFNDIQKLEQGAMVSVFSGSREYRYRVTSVEAANAEADKITLETVGRFLKLVTCNTFAKKEDRFIVTAEFVGAYEASTDA